MSWPHGRKLQRKRSAKYTTEVAVEALANENDEQQRAIVMQRSS
jgi:hypothetical protein